MLCRELNLVRISQPVYHASNWLELISSGNNWFGYCGALDTELSELLLFN